MYTLEKSTMKKFSYYRFSRWRGREPGTIIRPLQVCHEGSELYGYSNSVRDEITQIPWHKVADIRHSRARAGEALPRILSILEIPKKIGCVHGEVEEIVAHVSRDRAYTSPIRRIKSFHRSIEIFIPRKKDIITREDYLQNHHLKREQSRKLLLESDHIRARMRKIPIYSHEFDSSITFQDRRSLPSSPTRDLFSYKEFVPTHRCLRMYVSNNDRNKW